MGSCLGSRRSRPTSGDSDGSNLHPQSKFSSIESESEMRFGVAVDALVIDYLLITIMIY